jgi:hypothetical protein
MTAAFKEWAIVVDALGRGEQIFILRKGGIHEGRDGFKMEHSVFALFPTLFHQQRDSVIEAAQKRYDEIRGGFPPEGSVVINYFARVIETEQLRSFEDVQRLHGQHIWKEDVLKERFEWGKEQLIYAIAVRVFRLETALELPLVPEYGGCKSWIELTHEVSMTKAAPALKEAAFDANLAAFRDALHGL